METLPHFEVWAKAPKISLRVLMFKRFLKLAEDEMENVVNLLRTFPLTTGLKKLR